MVNVTSVSLAELKIYEDWKHAPLGTLLQTRDPNDNSILVGMRCEIIVNGSPMLEVRHASGNDAIKPL